MTRTTLSWTSPRSASSGTVSLKLYKGNIAVAGRSSPHALYDERFVTFGEDDVYQQSDAAGFIRLFGLSQRVRALKDQAMARSAAAQNGNGAGVSAPDDAVAAPDDAKLVVA